MKITINTGRTMKKQESTTAAYEAPKIEVMEVEVEQGFALSTYSGGGEPPAMQPGGNPF